MFRCKNIGEWLNGRATVSKTVGCVFDSRLPCHEIPNIPAVFGFFFIFRNKVGILK